MAEILMIKKFLYYSIMVGSFPILAQATVGDGRLNTLSTIIVLSLMMATLLPELLLVFPGYRKEVLSGIQDGDNRTNREDMKYFVSWYGPFSALRVLVFFSLFSMVNPGYEPSNTLVWAMIAVGTGTALPQIKGLYESFRGK